MIGTSEPTRRDIRVPASGSVWLRDTSNEDLPLCLGSLEDISLGGAKVSGEGVFTIGSLLELLIETKSGFIRATGKIAYSEPKDTRGIKAKMGISFLEFDPFAREAISDLVVTGTYQ